jgi:tRNA/tmRNA/rRNA uracil-C5-methylase (TrmA/RlmC/RlmD family)
VLATDVLRASWPPGAEVVVSAANSGGSAIVLRERAESGAAEGDRLVESVGGRDYAVPATGFWQVHPAAAQTLVEAVTAALDPRPGDVLADLYAGSGLFAGALAARVAPTGRVVAVESDAAAVAAARDNLRDLAGVEVLAGRVDRVLAGDALPAVDLLVADPPRTGLGGEVVRGIVARRPRRVAYVSCDPATLARDLATFRECGYDVIGLRAFDMFPMTHHLEAVATLAPSAAGE